MEMVFYLFIILLFTKFAGELSVSLGQPSVLGKLIAGVLIGPALLGIVKPSGMITEVSQIGVLLLMFIAGLETNVHDLRIMLIPSIAVAVGGILLPIAGGFATGSLLGLTGTEALFLGLLLSATSVSISVQTLRELGQLKSRESMSILGAAVLDDILVVILLAFMMSFAAGESVSIAEVVLKKLAFFVLVALIAWKVVPYFLKHFSKLRVSETIISAGLLVCLGFAYLAESLGVAGMIGAYFAGVAISQTDWKHAVEQKVEPIAYAIFVPVFFVSVGLSVSFEGIGPYVWHMVILSLLAVATKWIGSGLGARLTGFDFKSAHRIGIGMISRGEVALIIAAMGLQSGLLNQSMFTVMVIVVLVTTLVTPPLLKWSFSK